MTIYSFLFLHLEIDTDKDMPDRLILKRFEKYNLSYNRFFYPITR